MSLSFLHRWVGLVLCLIVLSISITGTMLLWKPEYLWLSLPQARDPLDRRIVSIAAAVDKIEGSYRPGEVRFVQLHSENLALHKIFLTDKRYAWHDQQGNQLQVWSGNERWEDWLLDLHHRFLLGNTIGLNIAGFSGLLLVPLTLIGLLLWWPRRRLLKLGVLPKHTARGAWMRSHGNLGALCIIPLLMLAITGVILVYPSESRWLLLDGFGERKPPLKTEESWGGDLQWQSVLTFSEKRYPDSIFRWLSPPTTEEGSFKVGLQQSQGWNRDGATSLTFESINKVDVLDALRQARSKRAVDFTYPLHTGKLGLWYRVLLTVFGFAMSVLCVFGLISYVKGMRK